MGKNNTKDMKIRRERLLMLGQRPFPITIEWKAIPAPVLYVREDLSLHISLSLYEKEEEILSSLQSREADLLCQIATRIRNRDFSRPIDLGEENGYPFSVRTIFGFPCHEEILSGKDFCKLEESVYRIYTSSLDDFDHIRTLIREDLNARLQIAYKEAWADSADRLAAAGLDGPFPVLEIHADQPCPMQVDLDRKIVQVHPYVVEYPREYILYSALSALAHLACEEDEQAYAFLMDELLEDWEEIREHGRRVSGDRKRSKQQSSLS